MPIGIAKGLSTDSRKGLIVTLGIPQKGHTALGLNRDPLDLKTGVIATLWESHKRIMGTENGIIGPTVLVKKKTFGPVVPNFCFQFI